VADALQLTYAGAFTYLDRTRALEFGEVSPEGIDLDWRNVRVDELFRVVAQNPDEYDISEMSLCTYMMMRAAGDDRLLAIPVFPSRVFRHNMVFVNTEHGIDRPEDLKGKKVGLGEYQMTAALWVRAALEHDYGVKPSDIDWYYGGYWTPAYEERHEHEAPPGVSITRIPPDKALRQMFLDGELDAVLTFDPPPYKKLAPRIRRLFPNSREVELDYFKRTGYFPIMHTVVVRRAVYDDNPWVATSMLEAFIRSKRLGLERLGDIGALSVMVPWVEDELEEVAELMGTDDAFPYGFGQNKRILEAMTGYAHEQGLTDRKLSPEDLFAPETVEHPGDAMP
jgi:4,5-dihydroxyphthalate decarboxylase